MNEAFSAEAFAKNLQKISAQSQRIAQEWMQRGVSKPMPPMEHLAPMGKAIGDAWIQLMNQPERLLQYQADYTHNYIELLRNVTERLLGKNNEPLYKGDVRDRRFKDPAWEQNCYFDFIKQTYLMTHEWCEQVVNNIDGIDEHTQRKASFCTKQLLNAFSPSNFAWTNPQILKATLETQGENWVRGLDNFLFDMERSKHFLEIQTYDDNAFAVGKNLAITPGKVVYQNSLMQLIYYTPSKPNNYEIPLLIIPAWIKKFYILDLQPENSLVKWLVDLGYSVFIISWVNPDAKLANKNFEDYLQEGPLAALTFIQQYCQTSEVNAIGYCLGGTLLTATMAYLKNHGLNAIRSFTLLTTLVDFENAGDMKIFMDEDNLKAIEARMETQGFFDGLDMSIAFDLLRANDMIWSFVVNNYMLGKQPFPFDLFYWNGDSTCLPAAMHRYYLRNMYQQNLLKEPGGLTLLNTSIDVTRIDSACYILATIEDHITPWQGVYKSTHLFAGPTTFVLSGSGHIAGVVNPPQNNKYGYWTETAYSADALEWFKETKQHDGSWWSHWHQWMQSYRGEEKPLGELVRPDHLCIEPAPGSYVLKRT